jgi:hypothetical protein
MGCEERSNAMPDRVGREDAEVKVSMTLAARFGESSKGTIYLRVAEIEGSRSMLRCAGTK